MVPLAASSTTESQKPGKQTLSRKEQELSEIDDTLKRLVDEAEIRRVVDGIDLATDAKDWELCRSYFTGEIFADFTSLAGGEPARIQADDLVNAWKSNLYADKLSHHMRTNHRISLQGDSAEVFSKGYALNILQRDTGSDLWEVWGEYTHTLERTPEGWRCSGMTFTVTHARGNEMARDG
jgi:DNA polymerase III sliding clamp (beta) subunit (PCNA family)